MELLDNKGRTEAEFLASYDKNRYEKPSVAADIVVFSTVRATDKSESYQVLLVRRGGHPFLGQYALPGGFVEPDETVEDAVSRELREETGVTTGKGYRKVTPQLLNVYSKPDRDPRMRVMSLAYVAVVNAAEVKVKAGDDAAEAGWFRINMTRTAINRESGVITYHLELTREDICLSANLDYRRWYGVLTDNEEWTLHDSEGLAFDHAKIIAEAFKKWQRMT